MPLPAPIDCVIFGGGAAGLWTLDAIVRSGRSVVLLESAELGAGQTVAAQGIIHGGFKYTLRGLLTASASSVASMPDTWRACLAGEREPPLQSTRVRAHYCHLWQTRSLVSAIGMFGARAGLRVTPEIIDRESRPPALKECPGSVARIAEQVIDPVSLLHDLARRHADRILRIDARVGVEFRCEGAGTVRVVSLINPAVGDVLDIAPTTVVLAAGAGNAALRTAAGLDAAAMQRRPLHMVMVRGDLPHLNGHCVDGARTRITITSAEDHGGRVVWQLGGQLAEEGVGMESRALIDRARDELSAVLPSVRLDHIEWATYHVDRAEAATTGAARPDDAQVLVERGSNVITAWPTKLALVPRLAELVLEKLPAPGAVRSGSFEPAMAASFPRPVVAVAPWEAAEEWMQ